MSLVSRKRAWGFGLLSLSIFVGAAAWYADRRASGGASAGKVFEQRAASAYTVLSNGKEFFNAVGVDPNGLIVVTLNGESNIRVFHGKDDFQVYLRSEAVQASLSSSLIRHPRIFSFDKYGTLFVEDAMPLHGDVLSAIVRKVAPNNEVTILTKQGYQIDDLKRADVMEFDQIFGMTSDHNRNLYVGDFAGRLLEIDVQGRTDVLIDPRKRSNGKDYAPRTTDLASHPDGSIVGIDNEQVVYKLPKGGTPQRVAGDADICVSLDGPAKEARFCHAERLAVAPDGTIYVLERECDVRKISANGIVSTVISPEENDPDFTNPKMRSNLKAISYPASLCPFRSIAVDMNGNILLAGQSLVRFNMH